MRTDIFTGCTKLRSNTAHTMTHTHKNNNDNNLDRHCFLFSIKVIVCHKSLLMKQKRHYNGRIHKFWTEKIRSMGGTDLERGYGDMRPWRSPFHALPLVRKGPISSKSVSSQDPLLRKFGNFSLYSLNFCPNFSSQAPKFGNFQLSSPQIWTFSVHKPSNSEIFSSQAPSFRGKYQCVSPTLRKSEPHTPTWKKVMCPPRVSPPSARSHYIKKKKPSLNRDQGLMLPSLCNGLLWLSHQSHRSIILTTSQDFFWWGHVLHVENSGYVNFHLVLKACLNLFKYITCVIILIAGFVMLSGISWTYLVLATSIYKPTSRGY